MPASPPTADGRADDTVADITTAPALLRASNEASFTEDNAASERAARALAALAAAAPESRADGLKLSGESLGEYVVQQLTDVRARLLEYLEGHELRGD